MGGVLTPGSGNKWYAKGDVVTRNEAISCKQTAAKSFSVTEGDVSEIEKICFEKNKTWLLAVMMGNRKLIVMPYDDYLELRK